jgi:hypothetical protein
VGCRQVYQIKCGFEFGTAPNRRREKVKLCPINCMLELAQHQLQKWARCSTAVFSFNVYVQREAVTGSSCSQGLQCHAPSPENYSPPCVATVANKLTGGGGAGLSPSKHPAYLAPALCMFGLLSIVFFSISCHLQLRFLGQARVGHETFFFFSSSFSSLSICSLSHLSFPLFLSSLFSLALYFQLSYYFSAKFPVSLDLCVYLLN